MWGNLSLWILFAFPWWLVMSCTFQSEKAMAPHSSILAWKIPWTEEPARLESMGSQRVGHDWATSLSLFHFHALEKEMATHSSVLAWRIPRTAEPGGLLSMGSHRVRHDWSDLAAVPFNVPVGHLYGFFGKIYIQVLCLHLIGLFGGFALVWGWVFLLLSFMNFYYILGINPLSDI